jgi:glutaredoxin
MKSLIRLFFRTLRVVLAPFVLAWFRLTRPKPVVRDAAAQQAANARAADLALYHFPTCPFCLRTRREIHRLALPIELRDARNDPGHRAALIAGGGKAQVPCLLIGAGSDTKTWLYESAEINAYLTREFGMA